MNYYKIKINVIGISRDFAILEGNNS